MDWPKYWIVQFISVLGGISGILGLLALWTSAWRGPLIVGVVVFCAVFFIAEYQKDGVTVRDRARRWTHEVDGETLYLGLLRRGSSGMNSSVMVLNRRRDWTLFDHHHDGWEGLWQACKPVNLMTWKGAASAGA